jgi:hypothetical protein
MATAVTDAELDELMFDTTVEPVADEKPAAAPQSQQPKLPTRRGGPFVFDLETIPDYDRVESFGLDPLPQPVPVTPADKCPPVSEVIGRTVQQIGQFISLKNPAEVWLITLQAEEEMGRRRKGVLDAVNQSLKGGSPAEIAAAERRKLLSVTPEYCRIAAIGWAVGGGEVVSWVATEPEHERGILEAFWECVKLCKPIVGFAIIGFDLPVIYYRSAMLRVPSTKMLDMRPWGKDVVDLFVKRFPGGKYGRSGPGKLKDLARLAGIEVPAGDMDGSQVEEMMKTDPVRVGEYVRSDVEITRALHRFYATYFCE